MMWTAEQWLGYGKILHPDEVKKRWGEVTAGDVRAAAAEFFRPDRINLALITPLKSAAALEKVLKA
jgi:predicted Zn-dependent peptidase